MCSLSAPGMADELMIAPRARVNGQEFEKVLHGFLVKTGDSRTNRRPFCASNPKHFEKGGKNGSIFSPFPGVQEYGDP